MISAVAPGQNLSFIPHYFATQKPPQAPANGLFAAAASKTVPQDVLSFLVQLASNRPNPMVLEAAKNNCLQALHVCQAYQVAVHEP